MTSTSEVLEHIDDAIADCEVGPDAVRFNAPDEARAQLADRSPAMVLVVSLIDAWSPVFARMATIVEAMHAQWARLHEQGRCPWCHPRANPPKLSIDGAEYSRRRKARRSSR